MTLFSVARPVAFRKTEENGTGKRRKTGQTERSPFILQKKLASAVDFSPARRL